MGISAGETVTQLVDDSIQGGKAIGQTFDGRPHYRIGDVYRDNNGHRWFVADAAGNEFNEMDPNSGYSYLISFEGVTTSSDGKRATNLPSKALGMKALVWLDMYFMMSVGHTDNFFRDQDSGRKRVFWNIINHSGFDPRKILVAVMPLSGKDYSDATHLCCFGLPNSGGEQRLLRFYNECEYVTSIRQPRYYLWEHYYDYTQKKFTQSYIYLQDINDSKKVAAYADDPFARQPLTRLQGGDNQTPRQPRTTTDYLAANVTNYLWTNADLANQNLSMWNEPVLLFRVTRVYDHGDNDYAKKTMDGLDLKAVSIINWEEDSDFEIERDSYANPVNGFERLWGETMRESYKDCYLDGVHWTVPKWNEVEK